ncbi:MAG: tetratricopeptide repeat protein [bacterium]
MPDVAKLKKKAADFELKKQFDKALAVYVEILDGYDASDEEVDVSLFNRVGDLFLKQGSVGDAVDYYEQAVDRYADGGFFNNAIALCNKILRNSPGRATVYYKLGKISAQKGFKSDAKKNFLEYADRMQSSGKFDEAFRALKEFADLCPDQDDIRLMLADQLSKKGRSEEAIEQLQLLYERYTHDGRDGEARAAIERMKAIDPMAEPRTLGDAPRRSAGDLVFLDLNDSPPAPRISHSGKRATVGLKFLADEEASPVATRRQDAETPRIATPAVPQARTSRETPAANLPTLEGVTGASDFAFVESSVRGGSILDDLEPTSLSSPTPTDPSHELLDFEPTSFERAAPIAPAPIPDLEVSTPDLLEFDLPTPAASSQAIPVEVDAPAIEFETDDFDQAEVPHNVRPSLMGLPMLVDENGAEPAADQGGDEDSTIGGDLELIMPEGTPIRGTPLQPATNDALPLLDLQTPTASAPAVEYSGGLGRHSVEMPQLTPSASANTPISSPIAPPLELSTAATPRSSRRQSTLLAEQSVELLKALSEADPDDHLLRRRLAETMLESGDREGGLRELETAMVGFERADNLVAAAKLADEIVLLNPESVRHHQKRVEYAFRTNERGRLIEAYIQLADALFRAGQVEKSRAIYQRVLDLAPDELRARAALQNFPEIEPAPEPPPVAKYRPTAPVSRLSTPVVAPRTTKPVVPAPRSDDTFINLGDWLRDDEAPKDTRMIVEEEEPTGDEVADFQDMLKKFKQGISENVEEEDHQSHYDLGVAFKEMGLLDEAIAEFQKALRAPANRVPTYEALGLCFIEKEQYPMAATILSRALHEPGVSEDKLVGVLYLSGRCAEERGQRAAAIDFYQRVFVVDIQFQDVGERLAAIEGAGL